MASISVELEDVASVKHTTTKLNTNRSFFFIETSRGGNGSTHNPPEFVLGYTRNIYAWARNYRMEDAGYLLILKFAGSDTAGRDFWRALQDLPEIRDARVGVSDSATHRHTFPRFRIRGRVLAGLVAGLVTRTETTAPEIVTDLPEFMVR